MHPGRALWRKAGCGQYSIATFRHSESLLRDVPTYFLRNPFESSRSGQALELSMSPQVLAYSRNLPIQGENVGNNRRLLWLDRHPLLAVAALWP